MIGVSYHILSYIYNFPSYISSIYNFLSFVLIIFLLDYFLEIKYQAKRPKRIGIILAHVIIFNAIFFVITTLVFVPTLTTGPSMDPFLQGDVYVLFNKLDNNPQKQEIVQIKNPDYSGDYYEAKHLLKRVIGLPGEKVVFKDGYIYVNNEKLEEDYLNTENNGKTNPQFICNCGVHVRFTKVEENIVINDSNEIKVTYFINLEDDEYLVLGDNRQNSYDSIDFGPIKKEDITGVFVFKLWPLDLPRNKQHLNNVIF
jgi:signal peptidase I